MSNFRSDQIGALQSAMGKLFAAPSLKTGRVFSTLISTVFAAQKERTECAVPLQFWCAG